MQYMYDYIHVRIFTNVHLLVVDLNSVSDSIGRKSLKHSVFFTNISARPALKVGEYNFLKICFYSCINVFMQE